MSLINRKARAAAIGALSVGLLLSSAACSTDDKSNDSSGSGSGSGGGGSSSGTVTLWSNATVGKGQQFFRDAVAAFAKANPDLPKIKLTFIQNEDYDDKIQTALQGGASTAPDIFFQRGGGNLKAMVDADQVQDLSSSVDASGIDPNVLPIDQIDGKTYAMPVDTLPGGFWYSKDLFARAGISQPPTSLAELESDDTKLKGKGITPIAVGGKDSWPAAHWYYWFALRECSQDTLTSTAQSLQFDDPCWTKAGDDLKAFAATNPFQKNFLSTPAQGATGASGMMANHKAAMELMGAWEPGVIGDLTPDQKPLPDLGFFPMVSVPGGQGDPSALMAGADGYSCSKWADDTCAKFLTFLGSKDEQVKYGEAFSSVPANKDAQGEVTDPLLKQVRDAVASAKYTSLWLDTLYGPSIGDALNSAVVKLLAGQASVQDLIDTVNNAGSKG